MLERLARRATQAAYLLRARKLGKQHLQRFGRAPRVVLVGARSGAAGTVLYLARWGLVTVIGFWAFVM